MYRIIVQRAHPKMIFTPKVSELKKYAKTALKMALGKDTPDTTTELTIRIVDLDEMTELNTTYRHKSGPTNVLSFPFESDEMDEEILIGDIVICAPIVNQEADAQKKTADAHWAHMVVHGTLHLLGHDHEIEAEALVMEQKEIAILKSLGFKNPYQITQGK